MDTEQAELMTQKIAKRMQTMVESEGEEWDDDGLVLLNVRKLSYEERRMVISDCVEAVRPDLVVVDGIRDLVLDFNEPKECGRLLNDLMKLCTDYNCGMVTIIHSNKGDRNARGHLGTELMNKSESVVELKKNGNSVSVEPKCCRGLDFESFSFTISEEGLPIISGDTPERKNEKKSVNDKEEIKQLFAQIMAADRTYSHQELQKEVSEKISIQSF